MASKKAGAGANRPRLSLHVPEPRFRPGDTVDFSHIPLSEPGAQPRPARPPKPFRCAAT
jgi:2-oxoisovalerate dehydrogenase E1 component alpha subunit